MANDERGIGAGTVLVSFLAGAVIGTGLALLFAPKSGKETRAKLRDLADDAVDKIREMTEQAEANLMDAYEEGIESIREKREIIKSAMEAGKEAIEKEKQRTRG
jgi:gas vesicle protein